MFQDLLTQSATFEEAQTSNVGGVVQKNWILKYGNVPVRLVTNHGNAKHGAENLEKYTRADFTLFMSAFGNINEKMRVTIDGEKYEIVLVAKVHGRNGIDHLELQLNKIIT